MEVVDRDEGVVSRDSRVQDLGTAAEAGSCASSRPSYANGCRCRWGVDLQAVVSGRIHIRMDDGTEAELSGGDAFTCAPGHDAWVLGDEPVVFLEVSPVAAQTYAAPTQ